MALYLLKEFCRTLQYGDWEWGHMYTVSQKGTNFEPVQLKIRINFDDICKLNNASDYRANGLTEY